jgi:type IV pilus assembly protein PilO
MHAEWPISLQLEGNYHNLGLFLDRVSKFPRIINIGNMSLTALDRPTASGASMKISATATTFVFVDPSTAPAATKKGPANAPAKKP